MTKLEKLYSLLENSTELGVEFSQDVLEQISALEEDIIKKEILPSLNDNIEPVLGQIKRELVLVVEYKPNEPLSVRLSRKMNLSQFLEAKTIEPDPEVTHKACKRKRVSINRTPASGLCVFMPDGSFIQEKHACDTFVEAIKKAGVMKVRALDYTMSKVKLVSNTLGQKYKSSQHPVGNGLYVITHSNTDDKKKMLEKISKALGLNWTIEIIKK